MTISRHNALVRGPAILEFKWKTGSGSVAVTNTYRIRTKDDVVFTPETRTFDVESSELGIIDRRAEEKLATCTFTPVGVVDADGIALLWPHLAKFPGQSLFGAKDVELTVWPVAGAAATSHDYGMVVMENVAVTKMPSIQLSPTKTAIGQVEVRGILSDDHIWGCDTHWYLTDDNAPTLAALNPASIVTAPANLAWGDWENIRTKDGVTIEFEMGTQDEVEDEGGVYDITLTDLKARARFTPVAGWDMESVGERLHNQDDLYRGGSVFRADLTATSKEAGGLIVNLFGCSLLTMPMTYGATSPRLGELTLEGLRGTGNAVASISIAANHSAAPRSTASASPEGGEDEGEGGDGEGEGSGTGT